MPRVLFKESLEEPLFCVSFSPVAANFVKGFADGRVTASSYDYEGNIKTLWTTKRHKGSCRAISYDFTGDCKYNCNSTFQTQSKTTNTFPL